MRLAPTSLRPLAALVLMLATAGCSSSGSPSTSGTSPVSGTAPAAASGEATTLPRLVFFMNPNGRPCQVQDEVLRGMAPELLGKISIVYVRTTVPAEIPFFGRYGVRALPQLLVVDGAGNEVRRATPGIQDAGAIRRLIGI